MDKGGENVQVPQFMLENEERESGNILSVTVYIISALKDYGEIFSQVTFHSFICFTF